VLIAVPPAQLFDKVVEGIEEELVSEYTLAKLSITEKTTLQNFAEAIDSINPRIIVLIGNRPISLLFEFQKMRPDHNPHIPSVAIMAIGIDYATKKLSNATGIHYDVPIVSTVTSLRSVINKPITTLGIVHRSIMEDMISTYKTYCKKEKIKTVSLTIPDKLLKRPFRMRRKIKTFLENTKPDLFWIPTDNHFFTNQLIFRVWKPLSRNPGIPIVVGIEALIGKNLESGMMAVVPDYVNLGIQTAQVIFEVERKNWNASAVPVQVPLSLYKIINVSKSEDIFRKEGIKYIDKVIE